MFRARQYLVFFLLIFFLSSLFFRLFFLQVVSFEDFSVMAAMQHNKVLKLEPRRGAIFDRYMEPLAINLDIPSIYCDPREIDDKERAAGLLSNALGVDREVLLERLTRDKAFIWVKRKVDPSLAEKVKRLRLEGVYFINESKRKYSSDNMASHVIGFAGLDNEGLEGLELLFNDELKGKPGWRQMIRDARMREVLLDHRQYMPPQNGMNLVLTIDSVIQYIAEDELRKMALRFNAEGASVVVMEPSTGKILALASYPDYDLNDFASCPRRLMRNAAVSEVYEPGSVFKIVTACAALEEQVVGLEDEIFCENGEYRTCGRILHDYHAYGRLTFQDVIVRSSNIGTVKVAKKLGKDRLFRYMTSFGFGRKTGIDLPGEVGGISRPPSVWSGSDISTIPMGQGIAVTPLQLACAVSVIANGGYLMRPYVVERIKTWEGGVYREYGPEIRGRVLSEETCAKIKEVLRGVVTSGTGRRADSELYETCGKTGTAQMVNERGGYYPDRYYASFIGFAPRENPVISIVVTARDPHPVHFGGSVAGPAFKGIAERSLQYLSSGAK